MRVSHSFILKICPIFQEFMRKKLSLTGLEFYNSASPFGENQRFTLVL
jgi:hypothetical protein